MRRHLGIVLVLTLAACGGGSDDTGSTTSTTKPAATTTTIETATISQYASIVAEDQAELLAKIDEADGCVGLYEPYACSISASLAAFTAQLTAQSLHIRLTAADDDKPNNGHYIGAVPEEIEKLVADTISAADEVATTVQAFSDASCAAQPGAPATPAANCSDLASAAWLALGRLENEMRAWGPYL